VALRPQQRLELHDGRRPQQEEAEDGRDGHVGARPYRGVGGGGEDRLARGPVEPAAAEQQRQQADASEAANGRRPPQGRLPRSTAANAPGDSRPGAVSPVSARCVRKRPSPAVMPPKSSAAAADRAAASRAGSSRQAATAAGSAANEP